MVRGKGEICAGRVHYYQGNNLAVLKYIKILICVIISVSVCSCNTDTDTDTDSNRNRILYHTPETLDLFLTGIHNNYPDITYLEDAGLSAEGRAIRALVISDNPTDFESEPRIRLTGSIHGDENVTTEVLIRLIEYITTCYAFGISRIKELVDSRYIVFIPMLNPDGVAAGSRYNANNVDLNRNFDAYWESTGSGSHGAFAFSESESGAFRDYSNGIFFTLSLTFHSGAVIVNMPFDYDSLSYNDVAPAEYDLVTHFGEVYSMSGRFLETEGLLDTPYVKNGTINGGDWYIVYGSLQDWSYLSTGCIDYTVEITDEKPEVPEEIDELFNLNMESMLSYIESADMGVYGRIINSSGEPLKAVVSIDGGDIVTSSDSSGYYHRVLLPGNYTIRINAGGYTEFSQAISVTQDPLELNITLN